MPLACISNYHNNYKNVSNHSYDKCKYSRIASLNVRIYTASSRIQYFMTFQVYTWVLERTEKVSYTASSKEKLHFISCMTPIMFYFYNFKIYLAKIVFNFDHSNFQCRTQPFYNLFKLFVKPFMSNNRTFFYKIYLIRDF